ncbi:MAG: MFS transporter [Eubacteriaceae bacterium]|jgi:MFS family permease|nr:MFS transporter [Eubacteriaceae bacterium]
MEEQGFQHNNFLAYILFLSIFMNGFEGGGYQTCLLSIGKEFALTDAVAGMMASAQLIAVLAGPLIFGSIADRHGKKSVLNAFLAVRIAACVLLWFVTDSRIFAVGIFTVGISISIIQSISIAGLADAYPLSGGRKIGMITSMYSLGAVTAPLICGKMIESGITWRMLFVFTGLMAAVVTAGLAFTNFEIKEHPAAETVREKTAAGSWSAAVISLLCFIMFVYVGVENGFAFFINSFMKETLGAEHSYLALSMFWLAMIPSRIICGYLQKRKGFLLTAAAAGTALSAVIMSAVQSGSTAVILSFVLGFFSGAIYPNVLNFAMENAGNRSATATGLITAATGLGGAVITTSFGFITEDFGIRTAFDVLSGLMVMDIAAAVILIIIAGKNAYRHIEGYGD